MKRLARLWRIAAVLGVVAAVGMPSAAHAAAASLAVRTLDTTAWPTVRLNVQYTGHDAPRPQDFTVRDHGAIVNDVTVRPLSETATPVGVVLVVDTSGSMRDQGRIEAAKTAAREFVEGRGPSERIAVVAFSDQARVVHPFSADDGAAGAVEALGASGGTALWDAVRMAAGMFVDQPDTQANIVVLSDGADSASTGSADDARNAAVAAHAVVHTVGFSSTALDGAGLAQLAQATGGQTLLASGASGLGDVFAQVRRSLDQQYQLSWKASGAAALDLTVSVSDASATAAGAAGSVSQERDTRPQRIHPPSGIKHALMSRGRPLSILAAALVAALAVWAGAMMMRSPNDITSKLRAYESDAPSVGDEVERQLGVTFVTSKFSRQAVDVATSVMEGHGALEWVEAKLDAARLPIRAAEATFFAVAFALLTTAGAWSLAGPFLAIVVLLLALLAPVGVLSFLGWRRQRRFAKQLPTMLQLLASSMRAGYALLQGFEAVAQEVGDPMGTEIKRVLAEARLGRPLEDSLEEAASRLGSADFAWVVMAISIQRNVGGNLAELLDTVADTMISRNRLRGEVKALTAEGRMSAIVLGIMPPGLALAMTVLSPGYLNPLFTQNVGRIMLGAGIVLMLGGFVWMQKIIKVEI
jgi:tight adherence protein B